MCSRRSRADIDSGLIDLYPHVENYGRIIWCRAAVLVTSLSSWEYYTLTCGCYLIGVSSYLRDSGVSVLLPLLLQLRLCALCLHRGCRLRATTHYLIQWKIYTLLRFRARFHFYWTAVICLQGSSGIIAQQLKTNFFSTRVFFLWPW